MTAVQATLIASFLSITVALIVFTLQLRLQIRLRRAELVLRLEDKYDQICTARMNKPLMMQCALNYSHKPYADMTPDERSFLHYCEMVLGFIEMSVYVAKIDRSLPDEVFEKFIVPMIRLEVRYNGTVLKQLADQEQLSVESKNLISKYAFEVSPSESVAKIVHCGEPRPEGRGY
jgi:hypothetical protein